MYSCESEVTIHQPDHVEEPVEALVLNGYLSNVPKYPSLAFSLRTLEHFRVLRLFQPSFSVEAFVKLLCHYYKV